MMTVEGNDHSSSRDGNVNLPKWSKVLNYFEKFNETAAIFTTYMPNITILLNPTKVLFGNSLKKMHLTLQNAKSVIKQFQHLEGQHLDFGST